MISSSDFEFIRTFLKTRSGLIITEDKVYLLESRLEPVMRRFQLPDFARLARGLRDNAPAGLCEAVIEAMTTNESLFFRDKRPFEQLADVMLPALVKSRRPHQPLRIWCAAASTGQEPYSIAMVLKENPGLVGNRQVEILGTDISSEVLARASAGLYSQFEVQRGLHIQMLLKHFAKEGDQWRISPELRGMVKYRKLNLLDSFAALGTFDIVFCRNVLIYFDLQTKENILGRIAKVLATDGYLVLGGAETIMGITEAYTATGIPGFYMPRTRPMEAVG